MWPFKSPEASTAEAYRVSKEISVPQFTWDCHYLLSEHSVGKEHLTSVLREIMMGEWACRPSPDKWTV